MNFKKVKQISVGVTLPLSVKWEDIPGINRVVHVFPHEKEDSELFSMYVVYASESQADAVVAKLQDHPGIEYAEFAAVRTVKPIKSKPNS